MKRLLLIFSLLASLFAGAQTMKQIIESPPKSNPKLVYDYTNTLTSLQQDDLNKKLYQYDDSTSNQILVMIVPSLDDYSVEDAAIALGRSWGVGGSKEFNNGVVILVPIKERKVTIQVGYGLEGVITDLTAKSIIDNAITPNFKSGNFYRGLDQGTDDIIKAAAGRYKAPDNYANRKKNKPGFKTIMTIIFVIFFILAFLLPGGGTGTYSSRGGYTGWSGWTGGGGSSGWSGGGGGGSSGGGFGGFGGGSFGGGGASGDW